MIGCSSVLFGHTKIDAARNPSGFDRVEVNKKDRSEREEIGTVFPDLVDVDRLGAFQAPSACEADSTVPVVFSLPAWAVEEEVFAP